MFSAAKNLLEFAKVAVSAAALSSGYASGMAESWPPTTWNAVSCDDEGALVTPSRTAASGPVLMEFSITRYFSPVLTAILDDETVVDQETSLNPTKEIETRQIDAFFDGRFVKLNDLHPVPLILNNTGEFGELTELESTKELQHVRAETLEVMEKFDPLNLAENDSVVVAFPNNEVTVVIEKNTEELPYRVTVHKNTGHSSARSSEASEVIASFCIRNDGATLALEAGVSKVVANESLQKSRFDFLAYCLECGSIAVAKNPVLKNCGALKL